MDTILVVGPLPLLRRSLRLPLGAVLAGVSALLLAGAAAGLLTLRPRPTPIGALAAQLPINLPGQAPIPTPAPPGIPVRVASIPVGTTILLEGQALGTTPATVAVPPGRSLVLRRIGAADVTVLDPRPDVAIPVWPAATVLPVRAPLPGGALTDLQVLANGHLALAVASAAAPTERQAWLDPTRAHLERQEPSEVAAAVRFPRRLRGCLAERPTVRAAHSARTKAQAGLALRLDRRSQRTPMCTRHRLLDEAAILTPAPAKVWRRKRPSEHPRRSARR